MRARAVRKEARYLRDDADKNAMSLSDLVDQAGTVTATMEAYGSQCSSGWPSS